MDQNTDVIAKLEPAWLRTQGNALREAMVDVSPENRSPLEKSIHRAHQLLSADLLRLEELREEKVEVGYADFFGAQLQEKIAAMIYLTQQKLLDIADSPAQILDFVIARHNSSLLVEILYRLNAAEGLGYLYDFASAHAKGNNPQFWQKVARHYLQLMAMLPIARPQVFAFLSERPGARHDVEVGIASVDVGAARAFRTLGEEYLRARKNGPLAPFTPAEYTIFYRQYVQDEPDAQSAGLSTRLAVQERIHRAIAAVDIPALATWFVDGSPTAVRYLMQSARSGLAASSFMDLLVAVVDAKPLEPVRTAAAILEMSEINRTVQPAGGDININQQLVRQAMTDDSARFGIARLAVQELGAIGAFNEVLTVMEQAPYVDVAGEGIAVLLELRRLPMADSIVARRASLQPAFEEAQKYTQLCHGLMDAAWACQNLYMAMPYLERLRELKALRELDAIAQHHPLFSTTAKRILSELRLEATGGGNKSS